jgi:hypothetical protein
MKNIYIEVECDVNDGDYISTRTSVANIPKSTIAAVYNKLVSLQGSHVIGEASDEDIKDIEDYLPYMDNEEVHTITSVGIIKMENIKLKDL